jgi:trk system potassium uptake protein TrkH
MSHHEGFAFYQNSWIQWGAPLFMLLGSINFGSHYLALKRRSLGAYWNEEEFRFYIFMIFSSLLLGLTIYFHNYQHLNWEQVRHLYFSIISLISSTGSVSTDFSHWPMGLLFIFIIISMFGGCHGSTTGGLKMIRLLILSKFYQRELKVLLHPQLISPIKYNNKPLDNNILLSLITYLITFVGLFIFLVFVMLIADNDFLTSVSIVAGTLSNSGIGLGEVSVSFQHLNPLSKFFAIIAMLAGRLEIFSLLIVFSLAYWKE